MIKYGSADIVRIDDSGMPGLWEITGTCDAYKDEKSFDYDYTVTNNECDSEAYVIAQDLTLVCKGADRLDIEVTE